MIFYQLILMTMFLQKSSQSPNNRCSCVSSDSCSTAAYGRLSLDIALLGVHAPCPKHGEVLCCDRSGLEDQYRESQPRLRILEQVHLVPDSRLVSTSPVPPLCRCALPSSCPTPVHGSLPHDIEVYGHHPPCPTPGETLCCNRVGDIIERHSISELVEVTLPVSNISTVGDHNRTKNDSSDNIEVVNDTSSKSLDLGREKIKIGASGSDLGTKCGCIPVGICLEKFRRTGGDQCDKTAGLELCCVTLQDEEHDREVQIVAQEDVISHYEEDSQRETSPVVVDGSHISSSPLPQVHFVPQDKASEPKNVLLGGNSTFDKIDSSATSQAPQPQLSLLPEDVANHNQEVGPSTLEPQPLSLVPCTPTCNGIAYSPDNSQHKKKYGVLAECSPGLVRCIYQLDLQLFLHPDNFNLPVFNVPNIISLFLKSSSDKSKVIREESTTQNRKGGKMLKEKGTNKSVLSSELQGKPTNAEQSEIIKKKGLPGKSKTNTKVETKLSQVLVSSLLLKGPPGRFTSESPDREIFPLKENISASPSFSGERLIKQLKLPGHNKINKMLKETRRKKLATKLSDRMKENSAAENKISEKVHMPDAKDITGVEIVMPKPTSQAARALLHMDKTMMEVKLNDDKLLSVLQALLIALE